MPGSVGAKSREPKAAGPACRAGAAMSGIVVAAGGPAICPKRGGRVLLSDEAQEFGPGRRVVVEFAQHHGRDHGRVLLFHAAHHHAHVLGFDDDAHACRAGDGLDGLGDLAAEVFLDLQAAGIHLDDAGDLGQAQDAAGRQVGHVRLADEGQHVGLAQRVQLDVLDQHDFAGVGGEQRAVDDFVQVLAVAAAQVAHGLGRAGGRVGQPFAGRVFP
ncbi:hypothetical protein G6F68_013513 [Rhizopus microsporus]|nr:hypothetical protein G6F68_013513 [Rhizopus microsporus]